MSEMDLDLGYPFAETLTVPLEVLLVIGRHMSFSCAVLLTAAMKPDIRTDRAALGGDGQPVTQQRQDGGCVVHGTQHQYQDLLLPAEAGLCGHPGGQQHPEFSGTP